MTPKELVDASLRLHSDRKTLLTTWQEIAENFYPERADFTTTRQLGTEYASYLMSSYPVLACRDLGDQIGAMLRPKSKAWFKQTTNSDSQSNDSKRWLERATEIQRKAMYSSKTQITRATKEADRDFAAFGQCVLSVRKNRDFDSLLYRNWHLRDVVWSENSEGIDSFVARSFKPTARELIKYFPQTVSEKVKNLASKNPFDKINCVHIVCDADLFSDDSKGRPFFSVAYDIDHESTLEAIPVYNREYIIPRWQTISGSQYAYSPASITALPDARVIQAMTYSLLEAQEKSVNPPMIATVDAVRSDMSLYAGGTTWVDKQYDERLGNALRPVTQDLRGIPFGADMIASSRDMIMQAFYLNKLSLPERSPQMTIYEVGQRVEEYIRSAMPIFEPMEMNYNGPLCDVTFDIMIRDGQFGAMEDIPEELRQPGTDIEFSFESPLHDAIKKIKGQKVLESTALLAEASAIDKSSIYLLDVPVAIRDAMDGIGVPAEWIRSIDDVAGMSRKEEEKEALKQKLNDMEQGANVASKLSSAAPLLDQGN